MPLNSLESYACVPTKTKGRLINEGIDPYRSCFQRDKDRILHSGEFRKLKYKTQVFPNCGNDYYRTRLTHSFEVASIARSIARYLNVNEDLAEAISLAHDIGHPPFGHSGEDSLKESMKKYNSEFDHNVQAIKIVTKLNQSYMHFNGLNLSWETLEGLAKHNGPVDINKPANAYLKNYNETHDLYMDKFPNIEAQISALSDDIAYITHDIDDGIKDEILTVDNLRQASELIDTIVKEIYLIAPAGCSQKQIVKELVRKLMKVMIYDLMNTTKQIITNSAVKTAGDVQNLNYSLVKFSPEMSEHINIIKDYMLNNMYLSKKMSDIRIKARRMLKILFEFYYENQTYLPDEWEQKIKDHNKHIVICDFIAGMTDRFAVKQYNYVMSI